MAQFYQSADLSVFPKQCSLSFYDAQACALPVILEDNNVNVGRVQCNNGTIFKSGDVDAFRAKMMQYIMLPDDVFKSIGKNGYDYVAENFNYKNIAAQYTKVLEDECVRLKEKSR